MSRLEQRPGELGRVDYDGRVPHVLELTMVGEWEVCSPMTKGLFGFVVVLANLGRGNRYVLSSRGTAWCRVYVDVRAA